MIIDGAGVDSTTLVLAHGAGAAMDTPFMNSIAAGVAAKGYRVARFEFPYMAKRRVDGKKRGPDKQAVLLDAWREAINALGAPDRLVIGGKSLGGRMASMIADECGVLGLVCLGYPFHPPGKPERLRVEHLRDLEVPTLILQGTRDPFGTEEEVPGYSLSKSIAISWLPDGDHGFKPRKRSGYTEADNLQAAVAAILEFMATLENKA